MKTPIHWHFWKVGLAATCLAVAAFAQNPPAKYALLVGVNEYQHARLPKLDYAVNDVAALAPVLEKAGYQVKLLCDTTGKQNPDLAPTKANIEKHLKAVLQKCRKGDIVVMAFAGHGLQFDGQRDSYFCPSDARPFADKTESLVSLGKVYEELDASFAGVKVLLVDACRNDPRGGRGSRGVDADSAPHPPRGVAALFSCSAGETANEDDRLKHGVFFHYVLKGLQGDAKDADGEVTFDGLSAFVRKQVAREVPKMYGADVHQSPNLKADLSGESPVLVRASGEKSPMQTITPTPTGSAAKTNQPPAGFRRLFNGKDLDGWKLQSGKLEDWTVADGILTTRTTERGWLMTEAQFDDFDLYLEFRVFEKANSGVTFHAIRDADTSKNNLEIQILDDTSYPNLRPNQYTGALYDIVAPSRGAAKPTGEWNRMRITSNGRVLTVALNDAKIIDADLEGYKDQAAQKPGLLRTRGYIGLQSWGGTTDFRNIWIK